MRRSFVYSLCATLLLLGGVAFSETPPAPPLKKVVAAGYTDARMLHLGAATLAAGSRDGRVYVLLIPEVGKPVPVTSVPKGAELTGSAVPFLGEVDLVDVDVNVRSVALDFGEEWVSTRYVFRKRAGGYDEVCRFAGRSGTRAGEKCGWESTADVSVVRVPGSRGVSFEITANRAGWETVPDGEGGCRPEGMPSHPAPDLVRYELPPGGVCTKVAGAGKGGGGSTAGLMDPDPPSDAGAPKLKPKDVKETMTKAKFRFRRCLEHGDGMINVELGIAANGSVAFARAKKASSKALGRCIADIVRTLRFPKNDGTTPKITYPIVLK